TKQYKSATVLQQFGDIFPTPAKHTSFRTDNMLHVLEATEDSRPSIEVKSTVIPLRRKANDNRYRRNIATY
ncbi:MAG: hypothetical protein ACXWOL_16850, partial [Ktedonobacteraceae bacterium]